MSRAGIESSSPAVRSVSTSSGMTAGHACEPGFTRSTPTSTHNGRENNQSAAGAMIAAAPASRTATQVRRDGPFHSSATR